jgi:ATP/maltotriose-dependent transcriptional regulator MalT
VISLAGGRTLPDILHLVRELLSNKEIAIAPKIEVSTVKFHLVNIFSKLQPLRAPAKLPT